MSARGWHRSRVLARRVGRETALVVVTLVVLLVGALLGSAYLLDRPATRHTTTTDAAAPQLPLPADLAVPITPLPAGSAAPTTGGLPTTLAAVLGAPALGRDPGVVVMDAMTSRVLYARRAAVPVPPASTAKLATAVAASTALGPAHRLQTAAVLVRPAGGPPRVVLVGGGDPTLADRPGVRADGPDAYPQPARLGALAAATVSRLRSLGIHQVGVSVATDRYAGATTAPGWKPGYVDEGDVAPVTALEVDEGRVHPLDRAAPDTRSAEPAVAAGTAFGQLLDRRGIRTVGPVRVAPAPRRASTLAVVRSPTVEALVARMLQRSDNDLAEALAREVARATHHPASFAGGAAAVHAVLARQGLGAGIRLVDGSGLSPLDRVTPLALTRLLSAVARRPALRSLVAALPVAGFSGTLATRFRADTRPFRPTVGAGIVRGKTGTLSGVSALAGLAVDAGGHLLAFAVLAPGVSPTGTLAAEGALDDVADTVVRCGCG